ncbi:Outer envelope protein 80, chloroplastic [Zea mays]|uniref:Outer envelope protein 80, chloroplastic n=1 Tax=Zea mays TaxID=4577 RepID=A0A3L6EA96_MAIZE|nr:Outer membrane OMP85 family protein [Zea mays]PWZ17864.1 Outer envelope protein 80, chloroplastic [Zea mays]
MGAQQSVNAGKAKVDMKVDLTHMLCEALLLPPLRSSGVTLSQIVGRISLKHPNLFGRSEKLDVILDKGINDSNFVIAYRRPRAEWLSQQSFVFQNIRPVNNQGHSIARDHDGFPLTCSGNLHDNMIILKQESGYADVNDNSFLKVNFQMEQGLPLVPKSLTFNRVKCAVSKGIKLGPTFLVTSLTGGSIVGDMAPYQAFAIGGLGSVRGYGEGAVGSGRLCLIANCEYTIPLVKHLEGSIFMDCGSDLGSARHVPGNPALRQGKPGFGIGFGYGLHFNTDLGQIRVDYAMNAFNRKTIYFGINSSGGS